MDQQVEPFPTLTTEGALIDAAARHGGVLRIAKDSESLLEIAASGHAVSALWATKVASSLVAKGRAIRIERGSYAIADAHGRIEPFAVGPALVRNGYTSLWSAADHYNLTTQDVSTVSVITDRFKPPVEIGNLGYQVVFHKTSPNRIFGFENVPIGATTARMAEIERLLIDLVWFHGTPGAPAAAQVLSIWNAAMSEKRVNPYIVAEYAARMQSHTLVRRVGYLLERFKQPGADRLPDWRAADRSPIPLLPGEVVAIPASRRWGIKAEGV